MTSTVIKILALIFMVLDHISEFIPEMPILFRLIGRISSPLFLFCMIWGFYYTRNRRLYLIRLYLFSILWSFISFILNNLTNIPYTLISNNIFNTFLLIGIIIVIIEVIKTSEKEGLKLSILFVAIQILSSFLNTIISLKLDITGMEYLISALIPNIYLCEGSYLYVFMGVAMYYTKESKIKLSIVYSISTMLFLFVATKGIFTISSILRGYQWLMIGALPIMLVYNGKRGKGMKYFFYGFYPVHIIILFILGNYIYKYL